MAKIITIPSPVDAHVHNRYPGLTHKEDWTTVSRAAAKGGIGTVFDMPNTKPPTTTADLLEEKRREATKHSLVNFGFHFGATTDNTQEIKKVANIASVKIFMGSSTGNLLVDNYGDESRIFKSTPKIITVHAEDEETIANNKKKFSDLQQVDIHSKIRSPEAALIAVNQAIRLAKETNHGLVIAHASTKAEIDAIKAAKKAGLKVYAEVTTHHLFLSLNDYSRFGNFVKVNPPIRSKKDNEALWEAINDGTIDFLGTDHAPHLPSEKVADYELAPAGIPGLESLLPLMLNAVNEGRLSLEKLIALTSTNQEKIYGFKNQAETVIDLDLKKKLKKSELQTKCKWSPWENAQFTGWPIKTVVNGQTVFENGEISVKSRGQEVKFIN